MSKEDDVIYSVINKSSIMKLLVPVKRVLDYSVSVRIKQDHSQIDISHAKMSMNPFDAIAVEEALRIKEKKIAKEVIAVSIGEESCQETLRIALAMGADRAIFVKTNDMKQPLATAKILKAVTLEEKIDLVMLGKQAIDTDNNQVGQMLAGLLNWPQGTFASQLHFRERHVSVTREIDGGLETILLTLPAVITTDLRLNEPRYLALPNIIQAKSKPIQIIPVEKYGLELSPHMRLLSFDMPSKERAKKRVQDVSELVHCLRKEAKVIA
jgi:electron transfer flavoprotein beta subunit